MISCVHRLLSLLTNKRSDPSFYVAAAPRGARIHLGRSIGVEDEEAPGGRLAGDIPCSTIG